MAAEKKNPDEKKDKPLYLNISANQMKQLGGKKEIYPFIRLCLDNKEKIKQFINQQNK